ncbi:hypothetical protein DFO67_12330 [Modicisalibacter xianhensis]|uniref:Uncharacterized protein n=1 Tax=Modicisalibacter xianhensis TaxID=442341 RepID=A0A4R8FDF2_9GAMM|nr:hypothetical protein DFO67_12330 [Halomonas xianhensis]
MCIANQMDLGGQAASASPKSLSSLSLEGDGWLMGLARVSLIQLAFLHICCDGMGECLAEKRNEA